MNKQAVKATRRKMPHFIDYINAFWRVFYGSARSNDGELDLN